LPGPDISDTRARGSRRPLLVLVALVLVAVAVVASASGRGSGSGGHFVLPGLGPLEWVFALAVVAGLVFAVLSLPGLRRHGEMRHRSFLAQLVPILLMIGLLFLWGRHFIAKPGPAHPRPTVSAADETAAPTAPEKTSRAETGLVVAVLAAGALVALLAARRPPTTTPDAEPTMAEEIGEVLDSAIDDLRADPEPRRAVIRCYDRLEAVLARHGLARRPSEAPLEVVRRVLGHLKASRASIARLTQLFEVAMFSDHAIDAGMQADAIAALVAVRDELRAGAPVAAGSAR
jgi:hypothetical protein